MSLSFDRPEAWPQAGDAERAETALGRWRSAGERLEDAGDRLFARELPESSAGRAMLEGVFGGSPFLESCLLAEPAFVHRLWREGPDRCFEDIIGGLTALPPDTNEESAGRTLRIARRRAALTVALADISGIWSLEATTGALSHLADTACSTALRLLLTRLAARGVLDPPDPADPEAGSGLITLGLGKLGGRELNYSSDIDLIMLYEPDAVPVRQGEDSERHLVRLARRFVAMLSQRTADGYVFRVDLRLRPDPSATPLVVSAVAARNYYRERGRTWERAALIKARPIAGDMAAARDFLKGISSFVWRRNLDFATVQELHDIKRQIDAQHGGGGIEPLGHDLKLGRGGIREIEFFAQTHQLVWGGRERRLRVIPTCEVLRTLADLERIPARVADAFVSAYRFLRRAEHRVQMTRDEQTHSLPDDPRAFAILARFLGYREEGAFVSELVEQLQEVERYYTELFELPLEVTSGGAPDPDTEETLARLGRLGFAHPGAAAAVLARWKRDAYPVVRDPRSRELLDSLTPGLLTAMLGTMEPDLALERFDHLLSHLPDGLQMFALFQANLHVMENVAEIMVSAPAIAERVTERPALFEALLENEANPVVPDGAGLEEELHGHLESGDEEGDTLARLHSWLDATDLHVLTHLLFHRLDPLDEPALRRSAADCTLRALLAHTAATFGESHGHLEGAECALLSVERPGARHSSIVSDRDLVLVHDAEDDKVSDGATPLTARAYHEGLLHRLGGPGTPEGASEEAAFCGLLPPAGGGALRWVCTIAEFERHCVENASPEERMALLRTRVAAGGQRIAARAREAIRSALATPCEAPPPGEGAGAQARSEDYWEALRPRGGLSGLEEFVQSLQVLAAPRNPALSDPDIGNAIRLLSEEGLLAPEDAEQLQDTWQLSLRIRALRGLVSEDVEMDGLPVGLRARFARAAGVDSFEGLRTRLEAAAATVRDIRTRYRTGNQTPRPTAP